MKHLYEQTLQQHKRQMMLRSNDSCCVCFLYCMFIQHKVNAIAMVLKFLRCDCIDFTLCSQHFMLIAFDLVLNSFRLSKRNRFIYFFVGDLYENKNLVMQKKSCPSRMIRMTNYSPIRSLGTPESSLDTGGGGRRKYTP